MNETRPLMDYAKRYAALGWRVFPIKPMAKFPPLVKDWPTRATADVEMIRAWWRGAPDANIGIALGESSGVFVIDLDVKNGVDGPVQIKALAERLRVQIP